MQPRNFAPSVTSRALDRVCAALFASFVMAVAAVAWLVPEREWDMVAYVALAIEQSGDEPSALHAATWEIVRQNTDAKDFTLLTMAGEYRLAQYRSPENFISQLPMYRLKTGYIALLRAVSTVLPPIAAMQAINAFSALLLGAGLLHWMRRGGFLQAGLLLAPLMMISGFVLMARLATPDLLVAALTVAGVAAFSGRWPWLGVAVLLAAFAVRPDTILFLFALVLACLALKWRLVPALTAFAVAAILSGRLTNQTGHFGWWPHFWFSTVEYQANMDGFRPDFSIAVYVLGLARGLAISLIAHNWLAVAAMLLMATWLLLKDRRELPRAIVAPMLAAVLAVGGKFLVFPLPDDRIYAVFLWIFAVGLLQLGRPRLGGRSPPNA